MRHLLTAVVLVLIAGCGGGSATSVQAPLPPVATGNLSKAQLTGYLLQPADLPDLPQRRVFASTDLTTRTTPQLALCRPASLAAPHEVANVIAESAKLGMAKVFEVLLAYPDAAAAAKAFAYDKATAYACPSYQAQGLTYVVSDLSQVQVDGGFPTLQYRLGTAGLVDGDVRTFAQKGRFTVFITGSGGPHRGQAMLAYQAATLRKALNRLPV